MTDFTNSKQSSNKPKYIAYHLRDREGAKTIWTRIGAAWNHADGRGLNLQIDAAPLGGRITLRVLPEKKD